VQVLALRLGAGSPHHPRHRGLWQSCLGGSCAARGVSAACTAGRRDNGVPPSPSFSRVQGAAPPQHGTHGSGWARPRAGENREPLPTRSPPSTRSDAAAPDAIPLRWLWEQMAGGGSGPPSAVVIAGWWHGV